MKAFSFVPRALLDSKLAIGLFAGFFLALVVFFSASPQFGWHSPNGELTCSPNCHMSRGISK